MSNVTTTDIVAIDNSSTVNSINNNIHTLRDEFDKVVYKDGREELTGNLDANNKRILNLPDAITDTEPMTLRQLASISEVVDGGLASEVLLRIAGDAARPTSASLSAQDGSTLVGFQQAGTGAVTRTVKDELLETVKLTQFMGVLSVAGAMQAAITKLGANGGCVEVPQGTFVFNAQFNVPLAVWKPVLLRGQGNTVFQSTHNGTLINDSTGNIRVENIRFVGPGLSEVNAIAIDTFMSQGWVTGCYFEGYRVAIEATGSSGGFIHRNQFTLCQEAIRCKHTFPVFGNALFIANNWIDFCTYAGWFEEMYGLILDNNMVEYNSVGWHIHNVREMDMRPNWYESNTIDYELTGACSGVINKYIHSVGGGTQNITWNADMRVLDHFKPSICVLTKNAVQAISHNLDTNVTWETETLDPAGLHSGTSDQITIKAPGLYEIVANIELEAFAAGTTNTVFTRINLNKNGTALKKATLPMLVSQPTQMSLSTIEELGNGDIIRLQVYQNTGGSLNLSAGTLTQISIRQLSVD